MEIVVVAVVVGAAAAWLGLRGWLYVKRASQPCASGEAGSTAQPLDAAAGCGGCGCSGCPGATPPHEAKQ